MIIILEEREVEVLIRKAVERKDVPIPEGYIIREVVVSQDEDVSGLGVEIHLDLEEQDASMIKINS